MSTKGSWQRPFDGRKWDEGFERIFGKKEKPLAVTVPEDLPEAPETESIDDQAP